MNWFFVILKNLGRYVKFKLFFFMLEAGKRASGSIDVKWSLLKGTYDA